MGYFDTLSAEKLREWRNKQGLTQVQAAKLHGVARATIINWESGAPIPNGVGGTCAMITKRWKMRDLFEMVTLVYSGGPMVQKKFGVFTIPNMKREFHRTNYDAINRACFLLASKEAHSAFITDQEGDVVWNMKELRRECAMRTSAYPRLPVITSQEARKLGRYNRILEAEILPIATRPGWFDVNYHVASPTGDEGDVLEVEQPLIQPGAVRGDKVDEVIQTAARAKGAQYVLNYEGF